MKKQRHAKKLRVCYFGTYEAEYARNGLLISGLRENQVEVIECNEVLWRRRGYKYRGGVIAGSASKLRLLFKILRRYLSLALRYRRLGRFDALIIGYPGYLDVYLARIITLFQKKKIIFDAYFSLYDTAVCDRGLFPRSSLAAFFIYQLEKFACRLADLVLVETQAGADYFAESYGLKKDRLRRLFTSADQAIFFPRDTRKGSGSAFEAVYYGSFIPFHGVEHIIDAAHNLKGHPGINFRLIGDGQYRRRIEEKFFRFGLPNVILDKWHEPEELAEIIAGADVCLGVFGDTQKSGYCLTNKVVEALAMKKPVVTADTPAAREVFTGKKDALLTAAADGRALAEAVLYLKDNPEERRGIAEAGHRLYLERLSPLKLGAELKGIINALINNGR